MKNIPETENALVIRTDFSNDKIYENICNLITIPVGEFQAYVDFLNDKELNGLKIDELISIIPENTNHAFIFFIDNITISNPENPILCIDLIDNPGDFFRVIPSEMWSVENNLSIANMDFLEFKESTDSENIFRGFSE